MNDDRSILLETFGPLIITMFLTVTAMFAAIPYALERHPFDAVQRQASAGAEFHPT